MPGDLQDHFIAVQTQRFFATLEAEGHGLGHAALGGIRTGGRRVQGRARGNEAVGHRGSVFATYFRIVISISVHPAPAGVLG